MQGPIGEVLVAKPRHAVPRHEVACARQCLPRPSRDAIQDFAPELGDAETEENVRVPMTMRTRKTYREALRRSRRAFAVTGSRAKTATRSATNERSILSCIDTDRGKEAPSKALTEMFVPFRNSKSFPEMFANFPGTVFPNPSRKE